VRESYQLSCGRGQPQSMHISTLCAETLFVTHAPLRAALGRAKASLSRQIRPKRREPESLLLSEVVHNAHKTKGFSRHSYSISEFELQRRPDRQVFKPAVFSYRASY
jgi:hypothetical protein